MYKEDYTQELKKLSEVLEYLGEKRTDICHEDFYNFNHLNKDELEDKYFELADWVEHKEEEARSISCDHEVGIEAEIKDHQSFFNLSIL